MCESEYMASRIKCIHTQVLNYIFAQTIINCPIINTDLMSG